MSVDLIFVFQDKCAENGKNDDRECPTDCKNTSKELKTAKHSNEVSCPTIKEEHSCGKTGKAESCGAIKKNIREDDDVNTKTKTSEANDLKTQQLVCVRKEDGLVKDKHDERNESEKEFEVIDELENYSTKEESSPTNKGNNEGTCNGKCSALNDQFSCHTSFEKPVSE